MGLRASRIDFAEAWLPITVALFVGCSHGRGPVEPVAHDAAATQQDDAAPKSPSEASRPDDDAAPVLDLTLSGNGVFVHASGDDGASAWTPVLTRNDDALTRCFRDFADSVLACRNKGAGDVHATYQVWAGDAPPSKSEHGAHAILEYAPLSGSADACADDYERSEDLGQCIVSGLGKGVDDFPAIPIRLLFTNYEGREGTIGSPPR